MGFAHVISHCEIAKLLPFSLEDRSQVVIVKVSHVHRRAPPIMKKPCTLYLDQSILCLIDKPAAHWKINDCIRTHCIELKIEFSYGRVNLEFGVAGSDFIPECAKVRNTPLKRGELEG